MFGFLKKKLKKVAKDISSEIEEDKEISQEVTEETLAEQDKVQLEKEAEEILKSEEDTNSEEIIKKKKEKKGFLGLFKKKSKVLENQDKKDSESNVEDSNQKYKDEKEISSDKKIEDKVLKKEVPELNIEKKKILSDSIEPEERKKDYSEEKIKEEPETSEKEDSIIKKETSEKIQEDSELHQKEEVNSSNVSDEEFEEPEEETIQRKSIFHKLSEKITKLNITDEKFEKFFWELEVALLENNVAVEVIEKIKNDLKLELQKKHVTRKSIDELILSILRKSIESLFDYKPIDLLKIIKDSEKPFKILFLGVNGAGKTTTLAKLINYFQKNNISSVVSASDTFRAAAIQQLQAHTNKLNVKIITQDYGADPAAVAYDAIEHAKAKNIDVVLIDTAGRLHSNSNLMSELNKIIRVAKPDMKIFIGESITGNDCVEQATQFNESVGIDAIILTKADVDEKGGVAISVSYVTGKPIMFITTGQNYEDIKPFNPLEIVETLFE